MPDYNKLSQEKNDFILRRLDALQTLIAASAVILSESLFRDFIDKLNASDGHLLSDESNMNKLPLIDRIFAAYNEQQGAKIIVAFVSDLKDIIALGSNYYSELVPNQVESKEIEKVLNLRLGITFSGNQWTAQPKGYIASLITDTTALQDIKQISANNILAGVGPAQLKKDIDNYLIGDGQSPSDYERYFRTYAYDTYSNIDRLNSKLHADRLNLRYFIYTGGLVADSREFCIENHGKCFSTEEAELWRELIGVYAERPGIRKKFVKVAIGPIVEDAATYDPVRDLGGIACRHAADFVSDEIAMKLRKGKK